MEVFIRAADDQDRDILGALKLRSSLAWGRSYGSDAVDASFKW